MYPLVKLILLFSKGLCPSGITNGIIRRYKKSLLTDFWPSKFCQKLLVTDENGFLPTSVIYDFLAVMVIYLK